MFVPAKLSPPEKEALERAILFTAVAFRGRCKYDKLEASSFEAILEQAPRLYEGDRPVALYACDIAGHQAMLGYWQPDKPINVPTQGIPYHDD